jgi:hypothetical protein
VGVMLETCYATLATYDVGVMMWCARSVTKSSSMTLIFACVAAKRLAPVLVAMWAAP